jgi:hypothetical protein
MLERATALKSTRALEVAGCFEERPRAAMAGQGDSENGRVIVREKIQRGPIRGERKPPDSVCCGNPNAAGEPASRTQDQQESTRAGWLPDENP